MAEHTIIKMKLRRNDDGTYSIIVTDEPGDKEILINVTTAELKDPAEISISS